MGDLLGVALFLVLAGWLGKFVAGEIRQGGVIERVFWIACSAAFVATIAVVVAMLPDS